ncbi:LacI family transcriptional regulator [Paractinoplanes abujensis]|uniref:DNA-binding LacI/PurR family transcriptional regulator n=1 Tax=Paractinoplanes abujensis TaxID=882441 RepID=A0A7W7G360_9ACTN|nr:LacI family DNA-binding transcriptional regulator [Actinoplanes abujensis]MBB4694522.1 DNA-binding LacI/PurR family transcriptional regulator [Actinoplanes abujensis]GID20264.1 LacI family transcriptional regulator [Actinoplanes abujensis]
MTQQDIARMTGVSQTTVSIVLNERDDAAVRIAPETREKVLAAIRRTGYVADPIARRLAAQRNRFLGVFTYEPVFPAGLGDFYHPFLVGIEECAERIGCDLLLFTSASVVDGRRRIFSQDNRLRLADGCILLGRWLDPEELARLIAEGQPFVSVGRRDDAGGPVPYVGADYPAATAAQVRRAVELGHRKIAYVGEGGGPESHADRFRGFTDAVARAGVAGIHVKPGKEVLSQLITEQVTAVFAEEFADGALLADEAVKQGLRVPDDLSFVALGDPTRPASTDLDFTGYRIPRREMGWQAVEVLSAILEGAGGDHQRLLPCEPVAGATLAVARA